MLFLQHFGFRVLLCASVVLLTVVLLIQGSSQEVRALQKLEAEAGTGWHVVGQSHYVAPAHAIAFSLSLPAFVLTVPLRAMVGSDSLVFEVVFVFAVGLLWYWIGRKLDRRFRIVADSPAMTRSPLARMLDGMVFVVCLGLFVLLILYRSSVSTLIFVSTCAWLLVFLLLFGFSAFVRVRKFGDRRDVF